MPFRASSLEEVGDVLINVFGDFKKETARKLFINLVDETPEATGALKFNWMVKPGSNAGVKYFENNGFQFPDPEIPDFNKYKRNWSVFTIYNNSPYIINVNNGESGNERNQNFIQRAMAITKNA